MLFARFLASRVSSTSSGDEAEAKEDGSFFLAPTSRSILGASGIFASAFLASGIFASTFLASGIFASAFLASGIFASTFLASGTTNAAFASEGGVGGGERTAARRFDPLRRDALGVQTRYPAVAKIVGRDAPQKRDDGSQTIPLYYGTGTFVAEAGEWGIVVSCWHVVNEARDSIVVKFPTFSSPARVILRDETWDLAALLVRKPPRVAPIPISQEVPGVGDALWVAGYGESAGLTEFQIQGGRVQNYALLVNENDEGANGGVDASNGRESSAPSEKNERDGGAGSASTGRSPALTPEGALLYETLAVDKGVRQGDSGGPIFNRYGELAGVLWGSNGESTMGTYCIRVQYFLTQAIDRLARLEAERRWDASADDLLTWRPENAVADAEGTELWARAALEASGVHPIAQRPAYVAADGRETPENLRRVGVEAALKRVKTALTVAENATATALPPSPPVFSPTFVSQQGLLRRVRPEVAESDFWPRLVDSEYGELVARRTEEAAKVRETSVVADEADASASVASAFAAESESNADFADEPPTLPWRGASKGLGALAQTNDEPLKSEQPSTSTPEDDDASSGELAVALWKPSVDWNDGGAGAAAEKNATNRENGAVADDAEKSKTSESANEAEESGSENGAKVGEAEDANAEATKDDAEQKEREKRVNFNGVYLNDIQVYLIICAIFCLFYNAARLMTDAEVKKERRLLKEGRTREFERRDD
ncbi:MAG: trypsin-like peptidase domain-containing protein [Thermoguttaceae bacterium]|nr:trypsin-like peptidase domain-containing protein [Thermoguttaceae bacterium]